MGIPKQVEEAGRKADEAAAKLDKEQRGEPEVAPVVVTGEELEPEVALPTPLTLEEAKGQVATLKSNVALLEHKYSVLQGKYDTEIKPASESTQRAAQLESTNSVLTDQLIEAKAKLAEVKAVGKQFVPPAPAAPIKVNVGNYFSPEAIKKLDNEGVTQDALELIVNAIVGASADQNKAQTANLVAPIEKGIKEVQENQAITAHQNFWKYIDTHVPDNDSVNKDPRWLKWLDGTITGTNFTRRQALRNAEEVNSAEKIVELFNEFKKSVGLPIPLTVKRDLKDAVNPINPGNPSSEAGIPAGENYTRAQVKEFFNDRAKGRYKHLPDDGQSLEDDITRAHVEGRIIN